MFFAISGAGIIATIQTISIATAIAIGLAETATLTGVHVAMRSLIKATIEAGELKLAVSAEILLPLVKP